MALANRMAQTMHHSHIGTEHLLLGLLEEGTGMVANVLKKLGVELLSAIIEVEKLHPQGDAEPIGKLPQTPRCKKLIEFAIVESRGLNHNYVGTEHMLLGLVHVFDGLAAQVLVNLGLSLDKVREAVLSEIKRREEGPA